VGTFEHFKSYGHFENFWKTTSTVMWEKRALLVTQSAVELRRLSGCVAAFF
jgi:hypothetical protein